MMWVTNFTSDDPIFPHGSVNVTIQDQELGRHWAKKLDKVSEKKARLMLNVRRALIQ